MEDMNGRDGESLRMYLEECGSMSRGLEEIFLNVERDGAFPADRLNEAFRLAHTIKGSSAMLDYAAISDASHRLEDALAAVRRAGRELTDAERSALADAGIAYVSYLDGEFAKIASGGEPEGNSGLETAIGAFAASIGGAGEASAKPAAPAEPQIPAGRGLAPAAVAARVRVRLKPCAMPHIRAYVISEAVKRECEAFSTDPAHPESEPTLGEQIAKEGFEIYFTPHAGMPREKIIEKLQAQPFCASVEELPVLKQSAEAICLSVPQERVSELINLAGELSRTLPALSAALGEAGVSREAERILGEISRLVAGTKRVASEMGMLRIGSVFLRVRRAVRGMARDCGKDIAVITSGEEILVDKSAVEALSDALVHLVRNAVDHGFEAAQARVAAGKPPRGELTLSARADSSRLYVTVEDDGAGIDRRRVAEKALREGLLQGAPEDFTDGELFSVLFKAGFSTNASVTAYSGRGVGLDAVKRRLEGVGGDIAVETEAGRGTRFTLSLPTSVGALNGVDASIGGYEVIIPADDIYRVARLDAGLEGDWREITGLGETRGEYAILLRGTHAYLRAERVGGMSAYSARELPSYAVCALGAKNIFSGVGARDGAKLMYILDTHKLSERQTGHEGF